MATMTLTPDGLAASPGWAANTGTINDALVTNDGDTTYAEAGTDTETCTLTFSAPSVAEGDISSITSVQFLTYGRFPARGSGGEDVVFNDGQTDVMVTFYTDHNSDVTDDDASDTVGFDNTSVKGDWIELFSDGTTWFAYGQSGVDGGILVAT